MYIFYDYLAYLELAQVDPELNYYKYTKSF